MSSEIKVAIFDVDGTLVDSQGHIHASMTAAFHGAGMDAPDMAAVRAIIGLSLPQAVARLAPDAPGPVVEDLVARYKDAYTSMRTTNASASSPLFLGMRDVLEHLLSRDDVLVAVATGKSRRGLDHVLALHGLTGRFVSEQTADHHPSKPHPSMIEAVLSETGAQAAHAVMIGDTSFDMEMGRAAGCKTLAVTWGYHSERDLRTCVPDVVTDDVAALPTAISLLLELADD